MIVDYNYKIERFEFGEGVSQEIDYEINVVTSDGRTRFVSFFRGVRGNNLFRIIEEKDGKGDFYGTASPNSVEETLLELARRRCANDFCTRLQATVGKDGGRKQHAN